MRFIKYIIKFLLIIIILNGIFFLLPKIEQIIIRKKIADYNKLLPKKIIELAKEDIINNNIPTLINEELTQFIVATKSIEDKYLKDKNKSVINMIDQNRIGFVHLLNQTMIIENHQIPEFLLRIDLVIAINLILVVFFLIFIIKKRKA